LLEDNRIDFAVIRHGVIFDEVRHNLTRRVILKKAAEEKLGQIGVGFAGLRENGIDVAGLSGNAFGVFTACFGYGFGSCDIEGPQPKKESRGDEDEKSDDEDPIPQP
jgi:hypothetical protein